MKDYYAILQLPRTASEHDVKMSYRKLVQQFHPDVNPDPQAHELIKEINEAYEVLGDTNKRRGYDFILDNPQAVVILEQQQEQESRQKKHRDPAYRRRGNYRPSGPSEESLLLEFMTKLLPLSRKISWVGCFVCLVLLIDFSVPRHVTGALIKTFDSHVLPRAQSSYLVMASGKRLKVSTDDWKLFHKDQLIEVVESGMFSILIEVRIPELRKRITNLSTIYGNYFFVPLLLLATSLLGVLVKEGTEFRFNLGIVNVIILIFTIMITLNSNG